MARQADSAVLSFAGLRPGATDLGDPALLRAQLARMTDDQLRRLLLWLDERGAPAGKTFAVHQADPGDPGSRDLIELQVDGLAAPRARPKLRVPGLPGLPGRLDQAAIA